jgi:hypothetical protein
VPPSFDATRDWPVLAVSATSDVEYRSSRAHLRAYADTALSRGWIVIAADAEEEVAAEQDDVPLRYALIQGGSRRVAIPTGHGLHLADSPGAQNTQAGSRRHSQRKAVTSSASTSRGSTRIRFWRQRASSIC